MISQSSTTLILSWAPPPAESQNGFVTGYLINVTSIASGESILLPTAMEFISVTSLRPYTMYLCSVAAQTAVGSGPYSPQLTITTNEEGTYEMVVIQIYLDITSNFCSTCWYSSLIDDWIHYFNIDYFELESSS